MSAFKRVLVQNSGTAFEDASSDLTTIPDLSVQLINAGDSTVGSADPGDAIDTSTELGAGNDITDFDEVRLAFRDANINDGLLDLSAVIPVSELEVTAFDYAAPVLQDSIVQVPSGPAGGGFWTIKVTNKESGNQPFERRSYEVEVDDNESAGSIAQKFADAINEAEDQINDYEGASVTASVQNTDEVLITAKEPGDIFDVATRNFDAVTLTDPNTAPFQGVGTPDQVARRENDDDGTSGRYVESTNLLGTLPGPAEYVQQSGQYRLHTFTHDGDSEQAVNKSIARQTWMVALESAVVGNATEANGDASIDDYLEFLAPVTVASG